MYENLITDNRKVGSFKRWGRAPDGAYVLRIDRPVPAVSGVVKTFKGDRRTKWNEKFCNVWPPPLRNVQIGETLEHADAWTYETPVHPVWGQVKWDGFIAADLVERKMLRSLMPGIPVMDTGRRDMALQRAYGNIEQPDFNSQLFLAEISETIAMLSNPFAGIQKIYKRYSKGRKRLRDLLKAQANLHADTYLQYMFGIKPLISDVQDIYSMVRKKSVAENRMYGKGTSKSLDVLDIGGVDTSFETAIQNLVWTFSGETRYKTTSKVYYNLAFASPMYDLVNKWGFNPIMLPVTMWETVPLSFVVDWFVGVKQWLMAMRPKPGVNILGNTTSEKLSQNYLATVVRGDLTINNPPAVKWDIHINKTYSYKYDRLIRQVNTPIPLSLLSKEGIDSVGKAVSSVALAFQKLKL